MVIVPALCRTLPLGARELRRVLGVPPWATASAALELGDDVLGAAAEGATLPVLPCLRRSTVAGR